MMRGNEMNSQKIENYSEGVQCGIGRKGIALLGGSRYEFRIILKSTVNMTVTVRVLNGDQTKSLACTSVDAGTGDWEKREYIFIAPETCPDASLEVVFYHQAELSVGAEPFLTINLAWSALFM